MAKSVLDTDYPVRTWSRSTVADGNWLNTNTIQPLIDRTNVLEEDQADLLNSTNHLVDGLGNDMEVVAGDGILFTKVVSTRQLYISVFKSSLFYNINSTHQAEYVTPTTGDPYFDLNTNIADTAVVTKGDAIYINNNSVYLKNGIYSVNCNIALNQNGTPDDKAYHFYLMINDIKISCPFNNVEGHTTHESMYNLNGIIKLDVIKPLEIKLFCDEDPTITGTDNFVIDKNTILQYLAISEL